MDGQTEVVNRTLSQLLRCFVVKNLKTWEAWVPHIRFAYNRIVNKTTSHTLFELVYVRLDERAMTFMERQGKRYTERANTNKEERVTLFGSTSKGRGSYLEENRILAKIQIMDLEIGKAKQRTSQPIKRVSIQESHPGQTDSFPDRPTLQSSSPKEQAAQPRLTHPSLNQLNCHITLGRNLLLNSNLISILSIPSSRSHLHSYSGARRYQGCFSLSRRHGSRIERLKVIRGDRFACQRTLMDLILSVLATIGEPSPPFHGDR
ncbi:hypothetical protein CR513_42594, partial [Mucuna pruriens]